MLLASAQVSSKQTNKQKITQWKHFPRGIHGENIQQGSAECIASIHVCCSYFIHSNTERGDYKLICAPRFQEEFGASMAKTKQS